MPRPRNGDVTTSEGSQEPLRFFVLPNKYAAEDEQTHSIVPLPHPKTETSSLYLKADSGEYLELVKFKEKRGSWIVEDFVEPDGSLYVATPMDPLFFAVALLQKSNKFRPLEDFVEDNLYPNLLSVINSCSSRLRHVADIKELGEDRVYRYNESKCIAWLTKKVKAVAAALESADIQVGATCVTAALVRSKRDTRPTNEDYMVTAHSIVADYVPPALGLLLKSSLGLDKKPAADKKAEAPSSPPPKKQRTEPVEPLEDYSQGTPKNGLFKPTKTPKLTASQKKLQKVDKTGMKSISSFFVKK
ncbi:ribonuclease H2 subunit B [Rhipicephalus microplus]|uniref:Ribonuclease H2 subunit B n=1 Tax=Rhipicephalus microplus TaxID=6941 RepID=A0A6M2CWR7_RHIMP